MRIKYTAFYQEKKSVSFDFSAERVSSDGGLLLLEKLARRSGLLKSFSDAVPDGRDPFRLTHLLGDLLRQRVFLLCCGYEDGNDLSYLQSDPLMEALFTEGLCSQPTMSRLENSLNMGDLYRLAHWWIDRYVSSLSASQSEVIIDVDCTDDPTHGNQQGSLFHGYYWQYQLNELFYIDGQSGQIILPVLRPGNVHSSKWNERFLRVIVQKIRARFPQMRIVLRADAGFSSPAFYALATELSFDFCIGIATNARLKGLIQKQVDHVKDTYSEKGQKHQQFEGPFSYQADSWESPQEVYAKIESTGKGMNVRWIISNFPDPEAEELYRKFYVQRGETAENRIKEIKNMCFSDRLSCHRFSANYFRLMLSALAYELLRLLREKIRETAHTKTHQWSIQSIRLYLIKVAVRVKVRVKSIHLAISKAFTQQNLFREIILNC
jgi:hypothetical protein